MLASTVAETPGRHRMTSEVNLMVNALCGLSGPPQRAFWGAGGTGKAHNYALDGTDRNGLRSMVREGAALSVGSEAIHTALILYRTSRNARRQSAWPGWKSAQGGSLGEPNL